MLSNEQSLFVFSNVVDEWVAVASNSLPEEDLFIFSPYATGSVIEKVFETSKSENKFFITSVTADAYLSQSLDFELLLNLIKSGIKVFHLPNLHAKVLVSGKNLIVGSQNFTSKGEVNVEASVSLRISIKEARKIQNQINNTLYEAYFITFEFLESLMREYKKLEFEYLELAQKIKKLDTKTTKLLKNSTLSKREITDEIEDTQKNLESHFLSKYARVTFKEYQTTFGELDYCTLQIYHQGNNFIQFRKRVRKRDDPSKRSLITLERGKRYLCFDTSSFRLFWVNANLRQIGRFLTFRWVSLISSDYCKIELITPNEEEFFSNIKLSLYQPENEEVVFLFFMFTGKSINFVGGYSDKDIWSMRNATSRKDLSNLPKKYLNEVMKKLPQQLFQPFYEHKGGMSPNRIFAENEFKKFGLMEFNGWRYYVISDTGI